MYADAAASGAAEYFMTSPSPGQIGRFLHNRHYRDDETYLYALADVMARQYEAIVAAGFVLQLDCPDLALSRHSVFAHLSLEAFRKVGTMDLGVVEVRHDARDRGLPAPAPHLPAGHGRACAEPDHHRHARPLGIDNRRHCAGRWRCGLCDA